MNGEEEREVVRCGSCQLRQFQTRNHHCRRCGKLMWTEPVKAEPAPQPEPPKKTTQEMLFTLPFGVRVAELRKAKHLSQQKVAARMGVPRTYISKVETNRSRRPYAINCILFAWALEVPLDTLSNCPAMDKAKMEEKIFGDPWLMELHEYSQHLSDEERNIVLGAARSLASGQYPIMEYQTV